MRHTMIAEVDLTPEVLAEVFAELDDEKQAQFFIEVARIAAGWELKPWQYPAQQWFMVGQHLRTCECSTDEARALVREIAAGVDA